MHASYEDIIKDTFRLTKLTNPELLKVLNKISYKPYNQFRCKKVTISRIYRIWMERYFSKIFVDNYVFLYERWTGKEADNEVIAEINHMVAADVAKLLNHELKLPEGLKFGLKFDEAKRVRMLKEQELPPEVRKKKEKERDYQKRYQKAYQAMQKMKKLEAKLKILKANAETFPVNSKYAGSIIVESTSSQADQA